MNPRTELEKCFPDADFSVYFREAEERRTARAWNTQDHHFCPRKQFPEFIDSPENLITVTVEDHAFLHKLLEAACGIKAPATALFEAQRNSASSNGRAAARKNKENGTGLYDSAVRALGTATLTPERCAAAGRIGGRKTADSGSLAIASAAVRARPGHQANAGRAGGLSLPREVHVKSGLAAAAVNRANGTGFYSKEVQSRIAKKRLHVRWHVKRGIVNPNCSLCTPPESVL